MTLALLSFPLLQRRRRQFRADTGAPERARARDDPRAADMRLPRGEAPFFIAPVGSELLLLIVDDDPLMTDLLPRKLRRVMAPHVRIVTASSPAEAAALLAREPAHIVLSDFNLRADKNGLDVLADAATRAPGSARILFSGHTKREIGAPLEQADIHGYVEKPMKLDELVASLLAAIRASTGLDLARQGDADVGR